MRVGKKSRGKENKNIIWFIGLVGYALFSLFFKLS